MLLDPRSRSGARQSRPFLAVLALLTAAGGPCSLSTSCEASPKEPHRARRYPQRARTTPGGSRGFLTSYPWQYPCGSKRSAVASAVVPVASLIATTSARAEPILLCSTPHVWTSSATTGRRAARHTRSYSPSSRCVPPWPAQRARVPRRHGKDVGMVRGLSAAALYLPAWPRRVSHLCAAAVLPSSLDGPQTAIRPEPATFPTCVLYEHCGSGAVIPNKPSSAKLARAAVYEKHADGKVGCGERGTTTRNADVFLLLFLFRRGNVSRLDPPAAPLSRVFRSTAADPVGACTKRPPDGDTVIHTELRITLISESPLYEPPLFDFYPSTRRLRGAPPVGPPRLLPTQLGRAVAPDR